MDNEATPRRRAGTTQITFHHPSVAISSPANSHSPSSARAPKPRLRSHSSATVAATSPSDDSPNEEEIKEFHLSAVDRSSLPNVSTSKNIFQDLDAANSRPRRSTSSGPSPSPVRDRPSFPNKWRKSTTPDAREPVDSISLSSSSARGSRTPDAREPALSSRTPDGRESVLSRSDRDLEIKESAGSGAATPRQARVGFAADVLHADFHAALNAKSPRQGSALRSATAARVKKTKFKVSPETRQMVHSGNELRLPTREQQRHPTVTAHGVEVHDKEHLDRLSQTLRLVVTSPKRDPLQDNGDFIIDDSAENSTLLSQEDVEYLEKNDAVSPSVFITRDKMLWEMKGKSTSNPQKLESADQELVGEWIGEAMDLLESCVGVLETENAGFFETHADSSQKFKRITHLLGKAKNALSIRLPQIERSLTTSILNKEQEERKQDKYAADVSDWISREYAKKSSGSPTPSVYHTVKKRSSIPVGHSRSSSIDEADAIFPNKSVRSKTLSVEMTNQLTHRKLEHKLLEVVRGDERSVGSRSPRKSRFRPRSQSTGSVLAVEYLKYGPTVLLRLMKSADWSFDVFEFGQLCDGRPLQVLVRYLFREYNLFSAFQVDPEVLAAFLTELEGSYLDVAYHNNYHAADVVQSLHFYFRSKKFGKIIALEDIFAGIVAAAMHDVGHPGNNNHFEIASFSDLAITYSDKSVLENFHLATGFRILQKQQCNLFANVSLADRRRLRETIIMMVHATDMQQHMHLVAKLQAVLEQKRNMKSWFSPTDLEDRRTVLTIGIHTADISSASKKLSISLEWAHRIHEEFWIQGDKERSLNLPVSAVMDRSRPNLQKSQIGFITLVVDPLYKDFQELCPELKACLIQQNKNLEYWKARVEVLNDIKKRLKDPPAEEKKD